MGKNGRILFGRPKPTAGCSASGRRRLIFAFYFKLSIYIYIYILHYVYFFTKLLAWIFLSLPPSKLRSCLISLPISRRMFLTTLIASSVTRHPSVLTEQFDRQLQSTLSPWMATQSHSNAPFFPSPPI
jgi:hypothetical protein